MSSTALWWKHGSSGLCSQSVLASHANGSGAARRVGGLEAAGWGSSSLLAGLGHLLDNHLPSEAPSGQLRQRMFRVWRLHLDGVGPTWRVGSLYPSVPERTRFPCSCSSSRCGQSGEQKQEFSELCQAWNRSSANATRLGYPPFLLESLAIPNQVAWGRRVSLAKFSVALGRFLLWERRLDCSLIWCSGSLASIPTVSWI